jgi:hypothetical protein
MKYSIKTCYTLSKYCIDPNVVNCPNILNDPNVLKLYHIMLYRVHLDINYLLFHIMFILNSLNSYFALLIKWCKLHFTRHYQYWDHYDSLILNQCLSPLKLCVRFPFMARCSLYIFNMFMLSSFRDLLQVSGLMSCKM